MDHAKRYVVDGNNVMAQRVGWHRDRPAARHRLVAELNAFARVSGSDITIVFDPPFRGAPDVFVQQDVTVLFPPKEETADHAIVELVAAESHPEDLVVVTSDRRLAEAVRKYGAHALPSGAFRKMIETVTSPR